MKKIKNTNRIQDHRGGLSMLSLKLYGPNDIRLAETEIPVINDNELLVKTDAAAICGTDIRMWQNGYKGVDEEHPLTLGHEFSGTIVKAGKDVPFYKEGMQVAVQPNIGCGICDRCVSGNFHLCDDYRAFGINMDGAFAEYIRIPADAVLRGNLMLLPEGVTPAEAAVTEPLSCAYNVLPMLRKTGRLCSGSGRRSNWVQPCDAVEYGRRISADERSVAGKAGSVQGAYAIYRNLQRK
jgi:threonine dehydrogenase-like Zn-dependent dehydrogenase